MGILYCVCNFFFVNPVILKEEFIRRNNATPGGSHCKVARRTGACLRDSTWDPTVMRMCPITFVIRLLTRTESNPHGRSGELSEGAGEGTPAPTLGFSSSSSIPLRGPQSKVFFTQEAPRAGKMKTRPPSALLPLTQEENLQMDISDPERLSAHR